MKDELIKNDFLRYTRSVKVHICYHCDRDISVDVDYYNAYVRIKDDEFENRKYHLHCHKEVFQKRLLVVPNMEEFDKAWGPDNIIKWPSKTARAKLLKAIQERKKRSGISRNYGKP